MQTSPTSSDDTLRSDLWGTEVVTLVGEEAPPASPSVSSSDSDDEYCLTYEMYVVQYDRGQGTEWCVAISTFAKHLGPGSVKY